MTQRFRRNHQRLGGGTLDMAAYAKLSAAATAHAPRTIDETRAAVRELNARGLGDYDIARATGLSVEGVRRLLGERAAGKPEQGPDDRGPRSATGGDTR